MEELAKDSYDLILLDLIMPKMNGFHLLREKAGTKQFSAIPVIVISSDKRQQCIDEVRALGAKHFLCKPFQPAELLSIVSTVLQKA